MHTLFSKSLAIVLSDFPDIEEFSSTNDVEHIAEIVEKSQPDILLVDINLGHSVQEDGLFLTKQLLGRFPEQKIVILSGYDLPAYRREAQKIGAKGFVNKEVEPEELFQILCSIQSGMTHFLSENVMLEDLTVSEKQVLRMIAGGHRRKEIAMQLHLSERTVSNHLQHIFEKLQVASSVEAVTKAIQLGYLSPIS
ncbi:response regulator transcription factor [Flintibacter muris]|uniref:response regulator transcription factor n=1 Tax=Flintibacter muris TaxID=2941327 RepID=UPI00204151CA|nr:response regulator transcription factor [Flintibacter muris]